MKQKEVQMVSEAREDKKKDNNLTVLSWTQEYLLLGLAKVIEYTFRIILLCLPLWVYLVIIQYREKVSTIRNISIFTNDTSVWQHIFPGFILVSVDPKGLNKYFKRKKEEFNGFMEANKYFLVILLLGVLFAFLIFHK